MMNIETVYDRLTILFHDVFDDDDLAATPELTAGDVDGWDSLTHLRLVLSIERSFKVKFSAAEIARLRNVGEMAELILSKSQ